MNDERQKINHNKVSPIPRLECVSANLDLSKSSVELETSAAAAELLTKIIQNTTIKTKVLFRKAPMID